MKLLIGSSLAGLAMAVSLHCSAAELFSTGLPNVLSGASLGSTSTHYQVAADFELDDIEGLGFAVLTGLEFWTFNVPGNTWPSQELTYSIWSNDNGGPGNAADLVTSVTVSATRVAGGVSVPIGDSEKWIVDMVPTKLSTDTTYWLSLDLGVGTNGFFWQYTNPMFGVADRYEVNDSGTWNNLSATNGVAFRLNGVPLPATALLLAIGLPGLLIARQQRKRRFALS